ncbi:MAG TPA: magnesium-translocating P-type ATPase [Gammaproteobacteria bacterium]|nr:magnesium-translocating P-type ATPase [Gammaproteobacteria bacterium]
MDVTQSELFSLPHQQVLEKLSSSAQGLTAQQAEERLATYGKNIIIQKKATPLIANVMMRYANPLVAILLIAATISALTGNPISAAIIGLMVLLSIGLDYLQSHRSLVAMQRLQAQVATTATVMRNQAWLDLPYEQLVPGDILRLTAGNLIPADALLLSARDLHVQQAALTGESLPVEKDDKPATAPLENITEAPNAVFAGSSVISGTATAVIIATGNKTVFAEIAKSLSIAPPHTEFEKGITRFGFFISKTILFLVIFVFAASVYFKHPLLESLLFAIALAVGLTPEFLPMITTVTLATGAMKMSHHGVIVKNLAAIQNLGSMDILCSDKTGTLTSGEMVLEQYIDLEGKQNEYVMLLAYLNAFFESGIQNPITTAILNKVALNPLDAAILQHAHPDIQPYTKIDEVPFDFERRRSSVVVDHNGEKLLITKGAPEQLLTLCTSYQTNDLPLPLDQSAITKFNTLLQKLSQQGYRTLAVTMRKMPNQSVYSALDETDLLLVGLLAFLDPPLKDVKATINHLKAEGVRMKILTGDNELVTQHICEQVGMVVDRIILGHELEHITEPALAKVAEEVEVFARVSPMQKQRIIAALRANGHVVGFLGDGINDAPSLHIADVGISVANAVDVAKTSASIILLKHRLKVILNGIVEGRKSFGNVMKYLMMGTSSNFGNMFSMAGAILFLPFLPMLPFQILLNNFLYDLAQVTIPTDHVEPSFTRKPQHWNIDIIRRFMLYIGPISSIFDFLTFFVMLSVFHASAVLFHTGWFVESLATQTLVIFVIRTAKNPFKSKPSLPLAITVIAVVTIAVLLPFSPLAKVLGFVALPWGYFLFLISATASYLLLVEFIKKRLMWKWLQISK